MEAAEWMKPNAQDAEGFCFVDICVDGCNGWSLRGGNDKSDRSNICVYRRDEVSSLCSRSYPLHTWSSILRVLGVPRGVEVV